MILSEFVETSLHPKTIKYYHSLGYVGNLYDKIYVKPLDLPKVSRVKILVKCDCCDNFNNIHYSNYNRQISRQDYYCCHPCSFGKNEITNLKKYGFKYIFQVEEVKEKIKKTLVDRYGYDHPTKCPEIFEKAQKSAFKTFKNESLDLKYQGSYELDFINYCINTQVSIEKGPTIRYFLDNKKRTYHSDFYLSKYNLICEVKSQYTFDCDYEENIAKKNYSIRSGYNFLFIIDKDYTELENIIVQYESKQNC